MRRQSKNPLASKSPQKYGKTKRNFNKPRRLPDLARPSLGKSLLGGGLFSRTPRARRAPLSVPIGSALGNMRRSVGKIQGSDICHRHCFQPRLGAAPSGGKPAPPRTVASDIGSSLPIFAQFHQSVCKWRLAGAGFLGFGYSARKSSGSGPGIRAIGHRLLGKE